MAATPEICKPLPQPEDEYNCPPVCPKCYRCHRGECGSETPLTDDCISPGSGTNWSRLLILCRSLEIGLLAANKELMSERERRVIAQEGCVKFDALIRELLTYNLPGDMHEKLMRVVSPPNEKS
jgi:hypothetical protein